MMSSSRARVVELVILLGQILHSGIEDMLDNNSRFFYTLM